MAAPSPRPRIVYPETDGLPMAENTLQFEWITKIKGGLGHLFAADPDVFVAGDLFWYPVQGHPEVVLAPDVMVAFGRPKGHRMSYLQWEEAGVPPQVVLEVLSPSNRRAGEMQHKFEFYRRHGVEEYYIYDPDPQRLNLSGFLRQGDGLLEVPVMNGHVSPRLTVRFEMTGQGLRILRPDGQPFLTYEEVSGREEQQRHLAEQERQRAERAVAEAEQERQRAQRAVAEAEQLRQRLRALGQEPNL